MTAVSLRRVSPAANLFWAGFVILFLELACIRWLASQVVFLQFFSNVVLIACFFGMSCGCLCARSATDWLRRFPHLLFVTVASASALYAGFNAWAGSAVGIGLGQGTTSKVMFFGFDKLGADLAAFVVPIELVCTLFFVLVALTFVGLGQVLGQAFDEHPDRVKAYVWNIAGSLCGIAAFSAGAALRLPPPCWFGVSLLVVAHFLHQRGLFTVKRASYLAAAFILVTVTGVSLRSDHRIISSPYYLIKYNKSLRSLEVDTISHQRMRSWREPGTAYSLIHLLQRDSGGAPFADVLIVGAGSGNDVSHALQHNVARVTAAEIDPVIQELGREFHPDSPYDDARVQVAIGDGRRLLQQSKTDYHLVVYGLVDSLVLSSSYSSVRLESFLYTVEAFREVRRALKDDGIFVAYSILRQGWILGRLREMAREAFGKEPLVFTLPLRSEISADDDLQDTLVMLAAGATERIEAAFAQHGGFALNKELSQSLRTNGFEAFAAASDTDWLKVAPTHYSGDERIAPARDDWPFMYLRKGVVPFRPYLLGIALMTFAGLVILRRLAPPGRLGFSGRMFFLGAGFLLLETKAVVQLSLLFGSTWIVNSVVFFTVLLIILAASVYALKRPQAKLSRHYGGLFITLALNVALPFSVFYDAAPLLRYSGTCALVFAPVFFAAVIFARSFAQTRAADAAYGSNIAGAVIGGFAEYASMILGFRHLVLLAFVFYLCSALCRDSAGARG